MIHMELMLPHRDLLHSAKVIGRTIGTDGQTTGSYSEDPRFNSLVYDVEFGDGEVKEHAADIIAENLLNQVDDEGFTITHLKAVVDYRKDETALDESTAYAFTKRGGKRMRKTTHGWDLLV